MIVDESAHRPDGAPVDPTPRYVVGDLVRITRGARLGQVGIVEQVEWTGTYVLSFGGEPGRTHYGRYELAPEMVQGHLG